MKLLENLVISTPNIDFLYQIIVQSWFASMTSFGPKCDKVDRSPTNSARNFSMVQPWPQLGLILPLRFPSWSRYVLGSGMSWIKEETTTTTTARSLEDETRNGYPDAKRNPHQNHKTIVLVLFSFEILNRWVISTFFSNKQGCLPSA